MGFNVNITGNYQPQLATSISPVDKKQDDKTSDTVAEEKDGDSVNISEEGKSKLDQMNAQKSEEKDDSSPIEKMIKELQKKIQQLKKEIDELKQSDTPDDQKKEQISAKENQMAMLQSQLSEAITQKQKGEESALHAKGFKNSLT
ncbi:hypothetical protein SAMN05660337_2228 [Maridesulfovibrio ferrireducens]|uniref:FlxA-like protein n=1 Tax=Maridesulfovibrio ferrireducens TaxID=246191 RepID=A0A1G9HLX1_9BACT|nr:hypothetical protein [Maridesulfovibrio ferrireducens]SDL13971.1 hypothetical protein SAMN05660337_2228 [Maridesulfovibrio ferrireducens]